MMTHVRLIQLWCALIGAIICVSLLPFSPIYAVVAPYDSNRWLHFTVYGVVSAIPVVNLRRRYTIFLSLVATLLCAILELMQAYLSTPIVRSPNVIADLFGIAAGILLGLNLRMVYHSPRITSASNARSSESTVLSIE